MQVEKRKERCCSHTTCTARMQRSTWGSGALGGCLRFKSVTREGCVQESQVLQRLLQFCGHLAEVIALDAVVPFHVRLDDLVDELGGGTLRPLVRHSDGLPQQLSRYDTRMHTYGRTTRHTTPCTRIVSASTQHHRHVQAARSAHLNNHIEQSNHNKQSHMTLILLKGVLLCVTRVVRSLGHNHILHD